jgi:hypothetical protein
MDELHFEHPELGARRMSLWLERERYEASRRTVARSMHHMGLEAIYRKPRISFLNSKAQKYPYPLRDNEEEEERRRKSFEAFAPTLRSGAATLETQQSLPRRTTTIKPKSSIRSCARIFT